MDVPAGLSEALARGRDDITFFAQYFLDMYPHEGQKRWFENSNRQLNVLVPGNRWGKSKGEAVKHLHKGFYKLGDGWENYTFRGKRFTNEEWKGAPYATINLSITADQAEIVHREIIAYCARPKFAPFVKDIRSTPFPHIVLQNGSVIHARSTSDNGKYIDGHHYAFASFDEAGWEKELDWLLGTVVLPRLVDWGGNMDIIGTPKGRGDLYKLMMRGVNGDPQVYSQSGSSYENPYVDKAELEKLEESLNRINPKLARQALHGDFVETDGLVFSYDQIRNLGRADIEVSHSPIAYGVDYRDVESPPDPTHRYEAAFDLARKNDRTVGFVADKSVFPHRIVRGVLLSGCPWEQQYEYIRRVSSEYSCVPLIDSTGLGDVVDEELTKRGIAHERFDFNDGRGAKKERLILNLQNVLDLGRPRDGEEDDGREWGLLRCGLITPLLDELSVYEFDDRKLDTDCVMALAMVAWKLRRVTDLPKATKVSMRGFRRRR